MGSDLISLVYIATEYCMEQHKSLLLKDHLTSSKHMVQKSILNTDRASDVTYNRIRKCNFTTKWNHLGSKARHNFAKHLVKLILTLHSLPSSLYLHILYFYTDLLLSPTIQSTSRVPVKFCLQCM